MLRQHPAEIDALEVGPKIFDQIQLFARIGRQPEDFNPLSKAMDLRQRALRGESRAVVQYQGDLLAGTSSSIGQEIQQAHGMLCDRVLPQAVRE